MLKKEKPLISCSVKTLFKSLIPLLFSFIVTIFFDLITGPKIREAGLFSNIDNLLEPVLLMFVFSYFLDNSFDESDFNILLSHDPSHWRGEILKDYPKVDLMLAGHTHGFQFGIEIPYFRWSPVQYVYKEWAGLYQEGHQYLYVNRGLGFLGYPGRVGILPEITLFELECA